MDNTQDDTRIEEVAFRALSPEPLTLTRDPPPAKDKTKRMRWTIKTYQGIYAEHPEWMPPLDVFALTDQPGRRVLADGHIRLVAARRAGLRSLPMRVHQGTLREAVLFAVRANGEWRQGEPLSEEDVRHAVAVLHDTYPAWTAEQIGHVLLRPTAMVQEILGGLEVRTMMQELYWQQMDRLCAAARDPDATEEERQRAIEELAAFVAAGHHAP
jgi:hypothetical protein